MKLEQEFRQHRWSKRAKGKSKERHKLVREKASGEEKDHGYAETIACLCTAGSTGQLKLQAPKALLTVLVMCSFPKPNFAQDEGMFSRAAGARQNTADSSASCPCPTRTLPQAAGTSQPISHLCDCFPCLFCPSFTQDYFD